MAVARMQCSFGADTAFPRDRMTITPHFNIASLGGTGWQGLADDLCAALNTWLGNVREVTVKAYDAEAAKPNPPQAVKTLNPGLTPASPGNREVSLCLSYYSGTNVQRRRGRLYIPAIFLLTGAMPVRPTQAQRDMLSQFVSIFTNLGGVNVDWVVWSRRDRAARKVTNWFVDDEWDVQRRRGLRPTTRSTGTTGEQLQVSEHFTLQEFACHDGTPVPAYAVDDVKRLCRRYLEPVRARWGPVVIISGYRTAAYNRQVDGAPDSMHIYRRLRPGAAADFVAATGRPRDWHEQLDELGINGLGLYPSHVHADTRSWHARW